MASIKYCEASFDGADGVARSASPIGQSPNRRPATTKYCAELATITASRYRARASRPSARKKEASVCQGKPGSSRKLKGVYR